MTSTTSEQTYNRSSRCSSSNSSNRCAVLRTGVTVQHAAGNLQVANTRSCHGPPLKQTACSCGDDDIVRSLLPDLQQPVHVAMDWCPHTKCGALSSRCIITNVAAAPAAACAHAAVARGTHSSPHAHRTAASRGDPCGSAAQHNATQHKRQNVRHCRQKSASMAPVGCMMDAEV
jgi:hypothetical protein